MCGSDHRVLFQRKGRFVGQSFRFYLRARSEAVSGKDDDDYVLQRIIFTFDGCVLFEVRSVESGAREGRYFIDGGES